MFLIFFFNLPRGLPKKERKRILKNFTETNFLFSVSKNLKISFLKLLGFKEVLFLKYFKTFSQFENKLKLFYFLFSKFFHSRLKPSFHSLFIPLSLSFKPYETILNNFSIKSLASLNSS